MFGRGIGGLGKYFVVSIVRWGYRYECCRVMVLIWRGASALVLHVAVFRGEFCKCRPLVPGRQCSCCVIHVWWGVGLGVSHASRVCQVACTHAGRVPLVKSSPYLAICGGPKTTGMPALGSVRVWCSCCKRWIDSSVVRVLPAALDSSPVSIASAWLLANRPYSSRVSRCLVGIGELIVEIG